MGGNAGYPVDDRSMMAARGMDSRNIGYGGGMPEPPLPPDASNTLYIEGIPTGCTRREVSRILRSISFATLVSKHLLHKTAINHDAPHLLASPSLPHQTSSDHLLAFVKLGL